MVLLRLKIFLSKWKQKMVWGYETQAIRCKIRDVGVAQELKNAKTLVLVPHADDESVGCGILLKNNAESVLLCNMNMPGGDSDKLHQIRYQELRKLVDFYKLRVAFMGESFEEKVVLLKKAIQEECPEYIAVPFFYDWHEEHIEVMQILKQALKEVSAEDVTIEKIKILMYQVSVPIPICRINYYLPMTKTAQNAKWKLFEGIYKTQSGIPWLRFQCNERINGAVCGQYACEAYYCQKATEWIENLNEEILKSDERKEIASNLQGLRSIRLSLAGMRNVR